MMATDNFETMNQNTIVVDDIGYDSQVEKETIENSGKHVLPFIYLRPGQPLASPQAIVTSPPTQLTTIINPANNTIVGAPKVYIQSTSNQVGSPASKGILLRQPIVTTPVVQGPKHIILRKPPVTTNSQIPINTTTTQVNQNQTVKPSLTYVGTIRRDSVVIPAGTLPLNQIPKQKILLSQIAQSSTSNINNSMSYSQPQNQMANIYVPVSIGPAATTSPDTSPQQTLMTSHSSVISSSQQNSIISQQNSQQNPIIAQQNLINPRQNLINPQQCLVNPQQSLINPQQSVINPQQSLINPQHSLLNPQHSLLNSLYTNNQSDTAKSNSTPVLRESTSSNSPQHIPPLHSLSSRISLLNPNRNGNNSSESMKIPETPDYAVITPIPIKDEPTKKRRTVSNIIRGNRDKSLIKTQKLSTSLDMSYSVESPPSEEKRKKAKKQKLISTLDINYSIESPEPDEKEKKTKADDDVTLIKVIQTENKVRRNSAVDLDFDAETTTASATTSDGDNDSKDKVTKKTGVNSNNNDETKELTNGNHRSDGNFDATKALDWKDGVGLLPGSSLKNSSKSSGVSQSIAAAADDEKKGVYPNDNQVKDNNQDVALKKKQTFRPYSPDEDKIRRVVTSDTFYTCDNCGCHGLAAEFETPNSCSPSCSEIIETKKILRIRKEKENHSQRAKRKRKKEQLARETKEKEEKEAKEKEKEEKDAKEKKHQEAKEKEQRDEKKREEEKEKDKEKEKEKEKDKEKAKVKEKDAKKRMEISKQMEDSIEKIIDTVVEESVENSSESSDSEYDTKDNLTNDDEDIQNTSTSGTKYPWQKGKNGFSWSKYLEYTKSKAAPQKLFKETQPYGKNLFKTGMKLEGIDPEHPSHYCVLTVSEVVANRIRLHFDGYPENFDFWVNSDSMDIFPVGWSEKNQHQLDPPKGYVASNFNWPAYLKTCKAPAAPKSAFAIKNTLQTLTTFRIGMKLEAVDRKHGGLVCVASIAGIMDSRILVHFDSWDEVYDYWADASSPYIHPIGWCHHNGVSLAPPNNYKDSKHFSWDAYLRETKSTAAPARAFKQRPPCGFKRGMKIEAVDKRVPQLVRVATIINVKDHVLKIHFDGWPEAHAYDVDDDSPDIHPQGWCAKTGHPLEPPLTPDVINETTECGTPGCRGIGHIKGPKFATHNSPSGCPYSPHNYKKIRITSDRLNVKHEIADYEDDGFKSEGGRLRDKNDKFSTRDERISKLDIDIKQEDTDYSIKYENERSGSGKYHNRNNSDGHSEDDEPLSKKRRKKRQVSEERNCSLSNSGYSDSYSLGNYAPNMPDKQLRKELYQSVYNPGYKPLPDAPHIWAKHSNALNRVVAKQNTNPRRWSNEEVIKFIQGVPNCKDVGSIFRKHSIDGEAFLMLTQEDLVSLLGLRLGPAIKLYNSIVLLRRRVT